MKNRLSLKLLSLLMCVSLFFFVCAPVSIFAEEEGENTSVVQEQPSEEETQSEPQPEVKPQRAETKVKGVKTKLNLLNSEKAVMNISVRPSLKGRKVVLQCYKSETKKYEKIKTYKAIPKNHPNVLSLYQILNDKEKEAIGKVCDIFNSLNLIPCTGCRYCVTDNQCPVDILIPDLFAAQNAYTTFNNWNTKYYYQAVNNHTSQKYP